MSSGLQVSDFRQMGKASVVGGILAGFIFGVLMQMMGMLPMIASMFGSESLLVGWVVHMIISVIFAVGYGILVLKTSKYYLMGLLYGILIWIIGPLVIMPMMMGMGTNLTQAFSPDMLMSLMTHIGFALILSFVYKKIVSNKDVS
jgi:uncharacterized membrane protein YagU involved in acid resistance